MFVSRINTTGREFSHNRKKCWLCSPFFAHSKIERETRRSGPVRFRGPRAASAAAAPGAPSRFGSALLGDRQDGRLLLGYRGGGELRPSPRAFGLRAWNSLKLRVHQDTIQDFS